MCMFVEQLGAQIKKGRKRQGEFIILPAIFVSGIKDACHFSDDLILRAIEGQPSAIGIDIAER